ncbi:nuclear transport factor 2 family protein [Leptolyngbya sp. FACHB-541]|uniref:ketosteroid isomerase family protein n=1 Tax=Leptolyngbya sp. FACHB-541 TaxID=2692810 RepID=UPI001681D6AE|nr:ketosteroid isomerase family protein [Leptolyngbya sp. FACHB-541]MBD1998437.1 nuclear transport factor 2 family protein [Leptolyngbya sp. FACHB-541]
MTVKPETISPTEQTISGISEPVIYHYFETLNSTDFQATAALFAADGVMHPPFDEDQVGGEAIANYLQAEAKGMKFHPRQGIFETLEDGTHYKITGKVQTPVFSVNVNWLFVLNAQSEILSVKIKLLASPQELLGMKQ